MRTETECNIRPGSKRMVIADTVEGLIFKGWSGDTSALDDPNNPVAIVTMPWDNVHVSAMYSGILQGISTDTALVEAYLREKANNQMAAAINSISETSGNAAYPVNWGFFYNSYAYANPLNIAAPGFHLPSWSEWETLIATVGGFSVAGCKLKEAGSLHWLANNAGTNDYGFNAVGQGYRAANSSGLFEYQRTSGHLPSSTITSAVTCMYITNGNCIGSVTSMPLYTGMGVRLICDSSVDPGVYVGNDGKRYKTVKIGDQVWVARNLQETQYRDLSYIGSSILTNEEWVAKTEGWLCTYNNL